jgi:hypothetical protein
MNIFKQLFDSTNYLGKGDNFTVKYPIGYKPNKKRPEPPKGQGINNKKK